VALFGSPDVRKLRRTRNIGGLLKALRYEKSGGVRKAAADALCRIGSEATTYHRAIDPRIVESLCVALHDDDERVRKAAAFALAVCADPRAVGPLCATLGDVIVGVREAAAESLGEIGDPRAVDALCVMLKDDDLGARQAAIKALGKIGDPRAAEALRAAEAASSKDLHQAVVVAIDGIIAGPPHATSQ
jgi:HEAT repeat protein